MKKTIWFVGLVFLAGMLILVSARNTVERTGNGPYIFELELNEGWNLIAGTNPVEGILADSEIKTQDIKVMWYYSPVQKKYIRIYPDADLDALSQEDDDVVLTNSMWIYVTKAGKIKYSTLEDYPLLSQRQLYAGYNFVTITPDMFKGDYTSGNGGDFFSWESIKGSCSLEKIYAWNFESQSWVETQKSTQFKGYDFDDFLGNGMVVKVSNNCYLNWPVGDTISPPALPDSINVPPINNSYPDLFPRQISPYSLASTRHQSQTCSNDGIVCIEGETGEYVDSTANKVVFVSLYDITRGNWEQLKEFFAKAAEEGDLEVGENFLETVFIGSNKLYRLEDHELFWSADAGDYPAAIITQEGNIIPDPNGNRYSYGTATGQNEVTKKFLELYPAQEVD